MAILSRSYWPERTRRPYLRLAAALVLAPLVVAAALTALTFLAAGSSEPTREAAMAVTRGAATVFFVALPAFSLTAGLAGVLTLWALGRRGAGAWALAGSAAGASVAAVQQMVAGDVRAIEAAIAIALGALILLLTRWIAGVRTD